MVRKVLLVGDNPNKNTGFANQLKLVADGFLKRNISVVQIGFNAKERKIYEREKGWLVYDVVGTSEFYEISTIINVIEPDVIISLAEFSWTMDYAKLPIKWRDRILHWTAVDCEPLNIQALHGQINFRKHIVFMADYGERIYKPYFDGPGKDKYKLYKIYHGIDTDKFKVLDRSECRKQLNLPEKFIALFVGKNQWRKRPDLLLRAWSIFAKDKYDVLLMMHTDPVSVSQQLQTGQNLPYLVDRFGLKDKVGFSKSESLPEDGLVKLMNCANVHCLFGSGEGFGIPLAETTSCGIPNIATKCTTIPEIIGDTGWQVESEAFDIQPDLGVDRPLISISMAVEALEEAYKEYKDGVQRDREKMHSRIVERYGVSKIQEEWFEAAKKVHEEESKKDSYIVGTKQKVLVQGSDNMSFSYGMVVDRIVKGLSEKGYKVEFTNLIVDHWNEQREKALGNCFYSFAQKDFDFHIRLSYPLNGELMVGRRNINIVPYEWQNLPKTWVSNSFNPNLDIICPLSVSEEHVFTGSGVPKHKVMGLTLGYNDAIFNPSAEPAQMKEIGKDDFVFVTLGSLLNLTSRKRTDIVLEAWSRAFKKTDKAILVIKTLKAGGLRPLREEIQEFMKGKIDFGRIVLIDNYLPESQVASIYKRADVKVSAFVGEGFGMTDLESMAVGCPVISTDGGGGKDFMNNDTSYFIKTTKAKYHQPMYVDAKDVDEGGWQVLMPDVDDLSRLMRHVYDNRKELKKKSEAGIERAKRFTWSSTVDSLEKMMLMELANG